MDIREKFRTRFGGACRLYRAPGRVNLIGEHTDYNDGFVMPAAVDRFCSVAAAPRNDRRIVLYSENLDASAEADLNLPLAPRGEWSDYATGVVAVLAEEGCAMPGANLYVQSDVPLGAGLSSSAALEVAVAIAVLDLADRDVDRSRVARFCQRAENEFAGARCGIMDQFIACNAREGHAMLLDCRSLGFRLLPLPHDVRMVICNTMVRHDIAAGEYNLRRAQCEEASRALGVRALRDVTWAELEQGKRGLSPLAYRRARHVVGENQRVLDAAPALEQNDLAAFGKLMEQSHASLRDDYEVSCPELDLMVRIARQQEGVLGARMTGGGFGGCTINLVRDAQAAAFRQRVADAYEKAAGVAPEIYVCAPAAGAEIVG